MTKSSIWMAVLDLHFYKSNFFLSFSKRIINLGPVNVSVTMRPPGTSRVTCAHCNETFLVRRYFLEEKFAVVKNIISHCRDSTTRPPWSSHLTFNLLYPFILHTYHFLPHLHFSCLVICPVYTGPFIFLSHFHPAAYLLHA